MAENLKLDKSGRCGLDGRPQLLGYSIKGDQNDNKNKNLTYTKQNQRQKGEQEAVEDCKTQLLLAAPTPQSHEIKPHRLAEESCGRQRSVTTTSVFRQYYGRP